VTVADDDGASTIDTLSVTVLNVAPMLDAGADQVVDEGSLGKRRLKSAWSRR
jgi:hypothetical protein